MNLDPTYAPASITYSTLETAWQLDVSKKTVMRRARQLGIGTQRGSGYWTFSPEDVKVMRSIGRMAGKYGSQTQCPACNGTGDDPIHTWGNGDIAKPGMEGLHAACEKCEGTGIARLAGKS